MASPEPAKPATASRRSRFSARTTTVVMAQLLSPLGTTKTVRGALAFVDAAQAASVKLPRACCARGATPCGASAAHSISVVSPSRSTAIMFAVRSRKIGTAADRPDGTGRVTGTSLIRKTAVYTLLPR